MKQPLITIVGFALVIAVLPLTATNYLQVYRAGVVLEHCRRLHRISLLCYSGLLRGRCLCLGYSASQRLRASAVMADETVGASFCDYARTPMTALAKALTTGSGKAAVHSCRGPLIAWR
jgi:hypothetical protein